MTVTTNQVLAGVGLILVLAVGSQVLASRLRIPALIVLLPTGFVAGAAATDVNPQRLLSLVRGRRQADAGHEGWRAGAAAGGHDGLA